jgi:glutamate N-acetyltransferase/amino-acid N-acetyltransferase
LQEWHRDLDRQPSPGLPGRRRDRRAQGERPPDLALVVNDGPDHHAAAVFTTNRVEAAPVTWSRRSSATAASDAVVLNSGGANACTGPQGFLDTHRTAEHVGEVARLLGAGDVVVCSTGLIGERLPMDKLLAGIDAVATTSASTGGPARRPPS